MRNVILLMSLFILCRCATKHQAIAFDPYFPLAPDELFTSGVMAEIQWLEAKTSLTLVEKKRLVDLYAVEMRRLEPSNDRAKVISTRAELLRTDVEPVLKRVSDLKAELTAQAIKEPEQKSFENPRLKKVYTQAYQAWNRDENDKALTFVNQIATDEDFKDMASHSDWVKILNLRFRVAMDLGLNDQLREYYTELKHFDGCAAETAQAGFIVALLTLSEGKNDEALSVFNDQCDNDETLSNRLKRAYWKFRFQKKDSKEAEKARRELLSLPMPGYYAYLSYVAQNEKMPVTKKTESKAKYLTEELSVSGDVHEWLLLAEEALRGNLRKDAGLYTGKAVLQLRENPSKNFLPLLYSAHLLRAAGLHLDSMKIFSFLVGQDKDLSAEDQAELEKEVPEVFPRPFGGVVDSVGKNWNVDPDFVYSIMRQESAFNPAAVSAADARGLMQLMPALAKALSVQWKNQKLFQDRILFSAGENVKLATFHLHQLETWGPHYALVAASYNAGVNRVVKWWQRFGHLPLDLFVELIPIGETRNYVKLVLRNYLYYKALKSGGTIEPTLFSLSLPPVEGSGTPKL